MPIAHPIQAHLKSWSTIDINQWKHESSLVWWQMLYNLGKNLNFDGFIVRTPAAALCRIFVKTIFSRETRVFHCNGQEDCCVEWLALKTNQIRMSVAGSLISWPLATQWDCEMPPLQHESHHHQNICFGKNKHSASRCSCRAKTGRWRIIGDISVLLPWTRTSESINIEPYLEWKQCNIHGR